MVKQIKNGRIFQIALRKPADPNAEQIYSSYAIPFAFRRFNKDLAIIPGATIQYTTMELDDEAIAKIRLELDIEGGPDTVAVQRVVQDCLDRDVHSARTLLWHITFPGFTTVISVREEIPDANALAIKEGVIDADDAMESSEWIE